MAGERYFTQIPPRSTGDRIHQIHTAHIGYTGFSGTWQLEEFYTIAALGGNNKVHVHGAYDEGSGTGTIVVHLNATARWNGNEAAIGANIIDPEGTIVATVTSFKDVYIPASNIQSYDNPEYGWNIDRFGSGQITFDEGQPQLDAFGKLRTGVGTIIGDYIFANDTLPGLFSTALNGNATADWEPSSHNLLLTNTSASGDLVAHTSNTYHHYIPGSSHLFMGTVSMSAGQPNLIRQWGLFDNDDGFMFVQIDGVFGVQKRTKVSGSIINKFIPQSEFNLDTCDGTAGDSNPSTFNIDLTKDNIYWIDQQWLGAGRVRFGTYGPKGDRIVMHEIEHANSSSVSHTTTGALPVCYVQRNSSITYDVSVENREWTSASGYSDSAIGSTAEFRAFCAAVYTESTVDMQSLGRTSLATSSTIIPTGSSTSDYAYVCSLAPKLEISSGNPNRSLYWISTVDVMAFNISDGSDARIELEFYLNPPLSNANFVDVETLNPINTVVIDEGGTLYDPSNGIHLFAAYINGNQRIDLRGANDSMFNSAFKNYAENGGTQTTTITGITSASPAAITADTTLRHRENGEPLLLDKVVGTIGDTYNDTTVYLQVTSDNTGNLYTDPSLSTPLDTSGLTYTSGGTLVGDFGGQINFAVVAKPIWPSGGSPEATTSDIKVDFMIEWKEIAQ